ncbi:hypothetical protein Dimus_013529 [Dionaea muscipula]
MERTLEEEAGSIRDVPRPDLGSSIQRPSSIEASRPSMASLPDLLPSSGGVTLLVELPNQEMGEGSPTVNDDDEGLVGQTVLHDEGLVGLTENDDCPVVAGDEPPSGLQVCPPSPLFASSILCDASRRSAGVVDGGIGQGLGSLNMVESIVDLEEHSVLVCTDADSPLGDEDVSVTERGCVGRLMSGTTAMTAGCMERDEAMAGEHQGVGDFTGTVSSLSSLPFSSLSSVMSADCFGVDGLVREEGRAPPDAEEALRLQSIDELRQLPRSPEEPLPVSVEEDATGGGLPYGGEGRVPVGRVGGDVGGELL